MARFSISLLGREIFSIGGKAKAEFNQASAAPREDAGGPVIETTSDIMNREYESRLRVENRALKKSVLEDYAATGESVADIHKFLAAFAEVCEREESCPKELTDDEYMERNLKDITGTQLKGCYDICTGKEDLRFRIASVKEWVDDCFEYVEEARLRTQSAPQTGPENRPENP